MFKVDEQFLDNLGLAAMKAEDKRNFMDYVQDQIELRVGERIDAGMNERQREEFKQLLDGADQGKIKAWLEANQPDFKEIVDDTIREIQTEIRENKDKILEQ